MDADESYPLTCVVDEVKPRAKVYWVIHDVRQDGTHTQVDPLEGDNIKKLTGTWTHKFARDPEVQELKCRVTDWDNKETELRPDEPYKPVKVYCE